MRSTSHIEDQNLKSLYDDVWDDPWNVLENANGLADGAGDRLAVLEVMLEACRVIIEDLEEHGEMNEALYDDHDLDFFERRADELEKEIESLRAGGATSDVFRLWQEGEPDEDADTLADDIVDEVMGTKGRKLVQALAASYEDDAEGFVAVLGKIGELVDADDHADHVTAYVQNALISHYQMGNLDGACRVVEGYAALIDGGFAHGEHHFEAVATSISIAQLSGRDEIAELVLAKLVPETIEHPRLAFNLACLSALRGKKDDLLRFTKRALELGKPTDSFQGDSDFDGFRNDPDFQALFE